MALRCDFLMPTSMRPLHTPLPLLLFLFVAVLCCADAASTDTLQQQQLRSADTDVCVSVRAISAFAVAHCNASDVHTTVPLDARCIESFHEFARDSDVFNTCEAQARRDNADDMTLLLQFKALYSAWQTTRVCEQFHIREAQAARECSGDNVHRPWNEATWPLFCHETFASYRANRAELDALCDRSADSPAFWAAYADYIATPVCKVYYDYVRAAAKRDCGANADASECVRMFEWYNAQQQTVETDCLELHNTQPFYRGFYRWKQRSASR